MQMGQLAMRKECDVILLSAVRFSEAYGEMALRKCVLLAFGHIYEDTQ